MAEPAIEFEGRAYPSAESMTAEVLGRYDQARADRARRRTAWIMGVAFLVLVLMVLGGMIYIVVNDGYVANFGRIK